MSQRAPLAELTWNDKPLNELSREELVELVGVLHGIVCRSAENFERVTMFNRALIEAHGGTA